MIRLTLLLLTALAVSANRPINGAALNPSVFRLFSNYVRTNTKIYSTVSEYQYRFNVFANNLAGVTGARDASVVEKVSVEDTPQGPVMKLKQSSACDFEMKMNNFFDLSDEEFKSYYLLPEKYFDPVKYNPCLLYTSPSPRDS